MVTVAEETKPARTAARGTVLQQLERTFSERVAELAETKADIARLIGAEDAALAETVRAAPTRRAYVLGSGPWKLRDRRGKLETKIGPLEREVAELAKVLAEERAKVYAELLEEKLKEAAALNERELTGWQAAGELVAELLSVWLETIVPAAEERDRLYHDALRSGLLGAAGTEADKSLSRATKPLVEPFPRGFPACMERLVALAVDPRRMGARDLPKDQVLAACVPDLRGVEAHEPRLSGRVERTG